MSYVAHAFIADPAERRGAERRDIGLETTLRGSDATPVQARLLDLSSEGFALETDETLAIGDTVTIGLPGVGRRTASVTRCEPGRYGCRFGAPITDQATLAAFAGDTVVRGHFASPEPAAATFPEPVVERWHPALRLTFLLGSASALWTAIFHLS